MPSFCRFSAKVQENCKMKFPDAMRLSRTDFVKLQEQDPDFRMILLSAVGKQRKGRIQMTQEQLRKKLERQFKKYPDCVFPEDISKMLRLGINTVYQMDLGPLFVYCRM